MVVVACNDNEQSPRMVFVRMLYLHDDGCECEQQHHIAFLLDPFLRGNARLWLAEPDSNLGFHPPAALSWLDSLTSKHDILNPRGEEIYAKDLQSAKTTSAWGGRTRPDQRQRKYDTSQLVPTKLFSNAFSHLTFITQLIRYFLFFVRCQSPSIILNKAVELEYNGWQSQASQTMGLVQQMFLVSHACCRMLSELSKLGLPMRPSHKSNAATTSPRALFVSCYRICKTVQ